MKCKVAESAYQLRVRFRLKSNTRKTFFAASKLLVPPTPSFFYKNCWNYMLKASLNPKLL